MPNPNGMNTAVADTEATDDTTDASDTDINTGMYFMSRIDLTYMIVFMSL